MSSKHARTFEAIFADPVRTSIVWSDIERMLTAAGCNLIEGDGSRVRFVKGGVVASFHRPHPAKEAKRHHVRDAREFLIKTGIKP